jgi:DNA gyrase/topoisomerase IV subunit B
MLANEEIRTLISAMGTGIGNDEFNVEKIRYPQNRYHDGMRISTARIFELSY